MSSYIETKLIECSRLSSEEYKSKKDHNPALFTNVVDRGLLLRPMDKISVHSSYISEKGAGGSKIEIKGDYIKEHTFEQIIDIEKQGEGLYDQHYLNCKNKTATLVDVKKDIYDNRLIFPIEYYKCANAENHMFLPRRFAYSIESASMPHDFTANDDVATGRCYSPPSNYILMDDYHYDFGTATYKPVIDGARYTAFIRRTTKYDGNDPTMSINSDPATDVYYLYRELMDIEVPTGFTAPDKLAEIITTKLKSSESPVPYRVKLNASMFATPPDDYIEVSSITNASTFKLFSAGNWYSWNNTGFTAFHGEELNQTALDHYNTYENVFFKRPELQVYGRMLNPEIGLRTKRKTGTGDDLLFTEWTWKESTLTQLNLLFDAEKKYPEIWSNINIQTHIHAGSTINNSRFIHLQPTVTVSEGALMTLGSDLYDPISASNKASVPCFFYYKDADRDVSIDKCSALFDDTDPDPSKHINRTNPLIHTFARGFAIPYKINETYDGVTTKKTYIALNLKAIAGAIPAHLKNASGEIEAGRAYGWDYHFNAYSTVAMVLLSGVTAKEYDVNNSVTMKYQTHTFDISYLFKGAYIGAVDPKMEFNTKSDKFDIINLHSPENTGQVSYSAGNTSDSTSAQLTSAPEAPEYKINKRPIYSAYTPDARPYNEKTTATIGSKTVSYIPANPNIQPWSIIDARSGIYICKDLGLNEDEFNLSLFKTLGFNYNQFKKPDIIDNTNNRLVRVTNDNINNLEIITTNANIVSDACTTFDVSKYGGISMHHILAYPTYYNATQLYPLIANSAVSVLFKSDNTPIRTIKPYYTIRSSIIEEDTQYIGNSKQSNAKMPIIAVVNKINPVGDFVYGEASDFEFVVTKEKRIHEIKTQLLDPDGSYIKCDDSSAVIYKIQRNQVNQQQLVLENLMKLNKK